MTIRRTASFVVRCNPEGAAAVVRRAMVPPRWRNLEEAADGRFVLRYRPRGWPVVLSTRVDIVLQQVDSGTLLHASTTSQRAIMGDLLNLYESILRDLGDAISRCTIDSFGWPAERVAP